MQWYNMGPFIILAILILWFVCWHIRASIPLRKKEPGFPYVHVEEDGSVRELTQEEQEYLQMEFHPADSGRPYIKYWYSMLTPDKKMWGFIKRRKVPRHIQIKPVENN